MRTPFVILAAIAIAIATFAVGRDRADAFDPIVTDLQLNAPDHVTVGDHVRYIIKVEADSGTTLSLPAGALPPALTLTRAPSMSERSIGGGRVEVTLTLELAPFAAGEIVVPPIPLRYQGPSGSGEVRTKASRIGVASVLPEAGNLEPRDLKPQVEIGTTPAPWLLPAVAAALILVFVLAVFVYRRRRALRRALEAVADILPDANLGPEDRARAELDRAGAAFAADGDYIAYYSAIAVTARSYLTARFGFPAFALTTRELQAQMVERGGMDRWQARLASGLLSQCDSVIFARYRPAAERADADLTAAYEIIEMTRPLRAAETAVS